MFLTFSETLFKFVCISVVQSAFVVISERRQSNSKNSRGEGDQWIQNNSEKNTEFSLDYSELFWSFQSIRGKNSSRIE